jgi:hypothetical protein
MRGTEIEISDQTDVIPTSITREKKRVAFIASMIRGSMSENYM